MSQIIHESLNIKGTWKIVWFGKMSSLPMVSPLANSIKVFLLPVDNAYSEKTHHGGADSKLSVAEIPIGELVRLHIGQIIVDGVPAKPSNQFQPLEEVLKVRLNFDLKSLTIFDRYQERNGQYIFPKGRVSNDPSLEGENNNLFLGVRVGDNPYHYIIPCAEVFRFFYATSSELVKEFISDSFIDPSKRLWNPLSAQLDKVSGHASFTIRKYMLDADAKYLARFVWDDYALERAQDIYLAAAGLLSPSYERMLYARPPIQGDNFIKCIARTLSSGSIFIRKILNCSWTPPYTSLEWMRDNQRLHEQDDPVDLKPSKEPGLNIISPPLDEISSPDILHVDKANPHKATSKIHEDEISDRFPNLESVSAIKVVPASTNPKKSYEDTKILQSADEGTVLDGLSELSLAATTHIESNQFAAGNASPSSEQSDSVDYLSVLHHLLFGRDSRIVDVEFCMVTNESKYIGGIYWNELPIPDTHRARWIYLDDEDQVIRKVLIARVTRKVGSLTESRYVVEIQPRRDGELSTLILWTKDESRLDTVTLFNHLLTFSIKGMAKIDSGATPVQSWGRLRHTTPFTGDLEDTKHFIERIFNAKTLLTKQLNEKPSL